MSDKTIEEIAYNLPVNNIIKISHLLGSKEALRYKVKLVKQVLKLIEKEIGK